MTPSEIANELERRGCRLYHAINLPDFRTYVGLGALVSRKELLARGIGTPFASDETDEERGVLDRCFGNLSDIGNRFWTREEAPPNVYGPILLVFKPTVFGVSQDAAVTLKNAIAPDYDLARDRITSHTDLRNLFDGDDSPTLVPQRFFVEFSTSTNALSFSMLDSIVVEPLVFAGEPLVDAVRGVVGDSVRVVERLAEPLSHKADLLNALAEWSAERGGTPPAPWDKPPIRVGAWWGTAKPASVAYRWFEYMVTTLRNLSPDDVDDPKPAPPRCSYCDKYAFFHCPSCGRWFCYADFHGLDPNGEFDAKVQGRCWECCYDPT